MGIHPDTMDSWWGSVELGEDVRVGEILANHDPLHQASRPTPTRGVVVENAKDIGQMLYVVSREHLELLDSTSSPLYDPRQTYEYPPPMANGV